MGGIDGERLDVERGDECHRIDQSAVDCRPGDAAVRALEDPVARDARRRQRARVQGSGLPGIRGDRVDGVRGQAPVRGDPGRTAVVGPEDAAARAGVERLRAGGIGHERDDRSARRSVGRPDARLAARPGSERGEEKDADARRLPEEGEKGRSRSAKHRPGTLTPGSSGPFRRVVNGALANARVTGYGKILRCGRGLPGGRGTTGVIRIRGNSRRRKGARPTPRRWNGKPPPTGTPIPPP